MSHEDGRVEIQLSVAADYRDFVNWLAPRLAGGLVDRAYPRQLRTRRLRPHREPCAAARGRASAVIEHPPGEEPQWDRVELPDPPAHWGWGSKAFLLVGALAHSLLQFVG